MIHLPSRGLVRYRLASVVGSKSAKLHSRRRQRTFFGFLAFAVLLAAQAVGATLLVEPYPAFVYPPFARDKGELGQLDVLVPEFLVAFADGTQSSVPLERAFRGIPSNLAMVLAKGTLLHYSRREKDVLRNMKPGLKRDLVVLRGKLRPPRQVLSKGALDPALRQWLRENLMQAFPGRDPVRFTARWQSHIYDFSSPPRLVDQRSVDETSCDLLQNH